MVVTWVARQSRGAVDDCTAKVGELVAARLAGDTAVQRLLAEAAEGTVTERTRLRAVLALEDIAEHNSDFSRELSTALNAARNSDQLAAGVPTQANNAYPMGALCEYIDDAGISNDVNIVGRLFFGRDDAEHDIADGLLREGFLPTAAFTEAVSGRKSLIIGRKGSGKSAICMRLSLGDLSPGETCLITPDDAAGEELRRFELGGLIGPAAKSLLWRYVFAVHAGRFLLRHSKAEHRRRPPSVGTLERFLRENGELAEGGVYDRIARASRGLTSSLSLEAFGVKVAVDAKKSPQGVRATRQLEIIESGVQQAFADLRCDREHGVLLLMVDQLEQVWSSEPASEALVIGLLLAGKHAAMTYRKSLRCVFFLRSDIYDALNFGDADKFHSDEIRIDWTVRQLRELAVTRASVTLGRRLSPQELWGEVFPSHVGEEKTEDYLFERTLLRPRDAIQFLNQCRDTAFRYGHPRISEADVLEATLVFSRWKVLDLAKEYGVRFPFLDLLLAVFRDSGYLVTRRSVAELFIPVQDDLRKHHDQYAHLFDPDTIIDLLYSVGFLGVRRGDGFVYAGMTESSIRPIESEFCIHPCFRPALNATRPTGIRVQNEITGVGVAVVSKLATSRATSTSAMWSQAEIWLSDRSQMMGVP